KTDFGDPTTDTDYVLCVYDEIADVPTLILANAIPAGDLCAGQPCWKPTTRGFKFANKAAIPDGLTAVTLKEGLEGASQITLKGVGSNLRCPPLPLAQDTKIVVQLKNDLGGCWGAKFSAPASRNEQIQFRDKSD